MSYTMKITDTQTGESRLYHDEEYDYDEYMWTEGNYGCDCNRSLFFALAGNEEEYDDECGERRYTAELLEEKR